MQGVSVEGVSFLLATYPELLAAFSGGSVDVKALMLMGGDVVASIIAAGMGKPGDEAETAIAKSLNVSEQADLLAAILRETLPDGVGPFVEKLGGMMTALGLDTATAGKVQATKSGKRSTT